VRDDRTAPSQANASGWAAPAAPGARPAPSVRARPGRLSALSVSHSEPVSCGAFVWARGARGALHGPARPNTAVAGLGSSAPTRTGPATARPAAGCAHHEGELSRG
jgi:hypothetical protein